MILLIFVLGLGTNVPVIDMNPGLGMFLPLLRYSNLYINIQA